MGLSKLVKGIGKIADPLGITEKTVAGSAGGMGASIKAAVLATQAGANPAKPPVTVQEHKSTTLAGGMRDITRESVKTETGGSGLDRFFPDYLK